MSLSVHIRRKFVVLFFFFLLLFFQLFVRRGWSLDRANDRMKRPKTDEWTVATCHVNGWDEMMRVLQQAKMLFVQSHRCDSRYRWMENSVYERAFCTIANERETQCTKLTKNSVQLTCPDCAVCGRNFLSEIVEVNNTRFHSITCSFTYQFKYSFWRSLQLTFLSIFSTYIKSLPANKWDPFGISTGPL